jgi:hypothetical protein
MQPRRDVGADLRQRLVASARRFVILIGQLQTTAEGAVDGLVRNAFGSAERLRAAVELLGEEDGEARALLVRAERYAIEPRRPEPPRRDPRPDAARLRSED